MKRRHDDISDQSQSNAFDHENHDPDDFVGLRVRMKWWPTPAVRSGYKSGLVLQVLGENQSDKRWVVDFDEYCESKVTGQLKKSNFWLRYGLYMYN